MQANYERTSITGYEDREGGVSEELGWGLDIWEVLEWEVNWDDSGGGKSAGGMGIKGVEVEDPIPYVYFSVSYVEVLTSSCDTFSNVLFILAMS